MAGTIAEKILAKHSGRRETSAGEIVNAKIDWAMVHEELGTPSGVAELFEKLNLEKVWNPNRIVALLDHWVPPPTISVAEIHKKCRAFVAKYNIKHWYDMNAGICHQVMHEKGFVAPGELIVGTDSHTVTYGALGAFGTGVGATDMAIVFATGKLWFMVPETIRCIITGKSQTSIMGMDIILNIIKEIGVDGALYKSIEYYGDTVKNLSIDARLTICNMSVEAEAKTAFIAPDNKTMDYVKARVKRQFKPVFADKKAEYVDEYEFNVSKIEPQVAKPPSPANSVAVTQVENIPINQAFIGSCTGGRLEDLRMAAKILKKRKIARNTRLIIIPSSYEVYSQALREGLIETFLESGAIVESPSCGPCAGGHLGLLASNEIAIATVSRNFIGRMGSPSAQVYLASAATVAASALKGSISDPRDILKK
jgi:3-isopropylmalate/(R)-2-methylmalate dehydratase large subunit